jgi:hypothetical protein
LKKSLLCLPLPFEFKEHQVSQRGMNAFEHVDLIEKAPNVHDRISVIEVLGEILWWLLMIPAAKIGL